MTNRYEIYKCEACGALVEVLQGGVGEIVCCSKPMKVMKENTTDASKEKHVPVISVAGNIVTVKVGAVDHPMEEKHYITFIALETRNGNQRKVLKPGDAPVANFALIPGDQVIAAYEHCNLHGLWKAEA